jgi:hypothetical protein
MGPSSWKYMVDLIPSSRSSRAPSKGNPRRGSLNLEYTCTPGALGSIKLIFTAVPFSNKKACTMEILSYIYIPTSNTKYNIENEARLRFFPLVSMPF